MAKIFCNNCRQAVIVDGQQVALYYEYDVLPFAVATPNEDGKTIVCTVCDEKLRKQSNRPARGRLV